MNSVKKSARIGPAERKEYERRLEERQNRALKEMNMTWLDEAEKRGERKNMLRTIDKFWTRRFGPVPAGLAARLKSVTSIRHLERIFDAIVDARDQQEAQAQLLTLCPDSRRAL